MRSPDWNAKHYYAWYRQDGGTQSYTWVKSRLEEEELSPKAKARGVRRKRRVRSPWSGLVIHQDGSTHEWVAGQRGDWIVAMDDATNEQDSMFFVEEEGTMRSLRGVREVMESRGLFSSFHADRGSYYWHTPESGGKVYKQNLMQFGQALKSLGIERIATYLPGSARALGAAVSPPSGPPTAGAGTGRDHRHGGLRYLTAVYRPAFNDEFMQLAMEAGSKGERLHRLDRRCA